MPSASKMVSLRALALSLTAVSSFAIHAVADDAQNQQSQIQPETVTQAPAEGIDSEQLHQALHEVSPAYEDGVFDSDASAVEALANEDPSAVAKLASLARLDLVKRQTDNTSITSTSSVVTSVTTVSTSTPTTSIVTPPTTTPNTTPIQTPTTTYTPPTTTPLPPPTTSTTATYVSSSSQTSQSTTSSPTISSTSSIINVPPPQTTTSTTTPRPVSSTSVPQTVPTSTSSQFTYSVAPSTGSIPIAITTSTPGGVPLTTSTLVPVSSVTSGPVISGTGNVVVTTDQFGQTVTLSGATDGAVITATDAAGRVITTTYHPGGEPIRSVAVLTSTLPNGSQSTLTSVAVIVPTVAGAGPSNAAGSSTATMGQPALVTGNVAVQSRKFGREAIALVAGAAGVAALL